MKPYKDIEKKYTPEEIAESIVFPGTKNEGEREEVLSGFREFRKQIAAAIAGAAKVNTPEFRKELDDAMRAVQRANTQEFRSKMGQLLAESAAQEPLPSPEASASPSAAAKPMQVKGGVMQGNLISDVNPLYPAAA